MDIKSLLSFIGVIISIIGVLYGYFKTANKPLWISLKDFIISFIFLILIIAGVYGVAILFDDIYSQYGEYAVVGIIFLIIIIISIPVYIYWEKIDSFLYTKEGKSKWLMIPDAERSLNENQKQFIKKLEKVGAGTRINNHLNK